MTKEDERLTDLTDRIIGELVYSKDHLRKAYNYYEGIRDAEQFRYLEENYGLGNPTSLNFTPLIKKHIDVLVGEYINIPVEPKISCKDKNTLNNIMRDKQIKIYEEVNNALATMFQNILIKFINGQESNDPNIKYQMDQLKEHIEDNFTSEYEIAAQNIIQYIIQSREMDFKNKLKILLTDLLIAGSCFYKVRENGTNIEIEILNPLNTFLDRNYSSNYAKHSYKAVARKYMTKSQIISYYRSKLDKNQISEIDEMESSEFFKGEAMLIRNDNCDPNGKSIGILSDYEVTPGLLTEHNRNYNLICVHEVEWLEHDKDGILQRYETIKIGSSIYVLLGKDEEVSRSISNPDICYLQTNGIFFSSRTNKEFSLVLATADQQDKYDMLIFFRDNLIASGGTVGDWVDVAKLPSFLGTTTAEKLKKWVAYKKQGVGLLDTSEEGVLNDNNLNTIYSGYDDTIKAQAIQAIELAISRIEETCSSITGVFRERIGGIKQRDAVSNVAAGITNSFNVTMQYFQQMDILCSEILTDCLNRGKIVYKKGITGSIILGERLQKVFTALPKYYTTTDFDIHVLSGADILKEIQKIEALIMEFIKAGSLDVNIILDAATSKSLTEMRSKVDKGLRQKKEENNIIQQLQQQLEQAQQQLKELNTQAQQMGQELKKVNSEKLEIEKSKIQLDNELGWYKAKSIDKFNDKTLELKQKQLEAEVFQLHDGNARNDEIKNIG